MALTKTKKVEILNRLATASKAESVVFVNFHGLPVSDQSDMRSQLRKEGVSYFVTRKTLLKKAFADAGIQGEMPELEGEAAIAYGDDLIVPAREIHAYSKKLGDSFSIVGGIFEGKFMSKAEMQEIAQIPGTDQLRGMFVNIINSPIQGFVMALDAIAQKQEA